MHTRTILLASVLLGSTLHAATPAPTDSLVRRHYIGTSAFMLGNFLAEPPSFYQLNGGYWLTKKDVIGFEAITWRYWAPLGIPYSDTDERQFDYPGTVRSWGLGVAYQHYWWKGLYTSAHVIPFHQTYRDTLEQVIQRGFQLYLILRAGYHLEFGAGRFFLEPALALPYWPVEPNLPESFQMQEQRWKNYFLVEPSLHLGVKF
ncbi:MAG: hypothetical protein JNM62_10225 [Flavobacteriales bacterium]|nr:hypothetical protein [Flavobacteriales bacterium]